MTDDLFPPVGSTLPPEFNDGKAPDALRTIGEVTRALGIRQHVLRYWEEQFPMLAPVKRSGNRRYYRPEDIALIAQIDRLVHREGFTLRGARLALEGDKARGKLASASSPALGAEPVIDKVVTPSSSSILGELQAIRDDLARALANA